MGELYCWRGAMDGGRSGMLEELLERTEDDFVDIGETEFRIPDKADGTCCSNVVDAGALVIVEVLVTWGRNAYRM